MPSTPHILLLAAAPAEARSVAAAFHAPPPTEDWHPTNLAPGWSLLRTGVGKVNAALAATRALAHNPSIILNLGVCGSLPAPTTPPLNSIIIATSSVYADEGIATPDRFLDMAAQGFGYWPSAAIHPGPCSCSAIETDKQLVHWAHTALAAAAIEQPVLTAPIATVSTCSGTSALSTAIAARTGAIAEAMEGAAIAHALHRLAPAVPFLELRVVSNTTGDRNAQLWDLKGALATLTRVVTALHAASPRLPPPPLRPAGETPAARAE